MRYFARVSLFVLAGVGTSIIYTATVGLLSAQALAARAGAVLDLNNVIVGVQDPKIPYLQMAAVVAIALLAAYVVAYAPRRSKMSNRIAISTGFLASTAALVVYTIINVQGGDSLQSIADGTLPGWQGWLLKASNDSSLHLILVLTVFLVAFLILEAVRRNASKKGAGLEDHEARRSEV